MTIPKLKGIDHIHIFVSDRPRAERWYGDVLGFRRVAEFEQWAVDGGPLTIVDSESSTHLALFEGEAKNNRATIALKVDGEEMLNWQTHLSSVLETDVDLVDHELSWSIYFSDPDGNPFEITTYDYEWLLSKQ